MKLKIASSIAITLGALTLFFWHLHVRASSVSIFMGCDLIQHCTAPIWVSSGLGANQIMVLQSVTNNNLGVFDLPSQVTPPAPGHAHTIETGSAAAASGTVASNTITYDVVQNGKTIATCTFILQDNSDFLSGTGSCTGGFAAPVNAITSSDGGAGLDLGIN